MQFYRIFDAIQCKICFFLTVFDAKQEEEDYSESDNESSEIEVHVDEVIDDGEDFDDNNNIIKTEGTSIFLQVFFFSIFFCFSSVTVIILFINTLTLNMTTPLTIFIPSSHHINHHIHHITKHNPT